MQNRILAITRTTIPYVPQLRTLAGSVTATILWQRLDYWFNKFPDGFFHFQEPSQNPMYKKGYSWTEELKFSKAEFRTAFKYIGYAYQSQTVYDNTDKPFTINNKTVFFVSVRNKKNGLTFYYRNHDLVDKALDSIIYSKDNSN